MYCRDADDMRAVGRMAHFPASDAMVICRVRLSQCQAAMMDQQRFAPTQSSRGAKAGPGSVAPTTAASLPSESTHPKEYQAALLGMKLTAGFEIMWARAAKLGKLPGQSQRDAEGSSVAQPSAEASDMTTTTRVVSTCPRTEPSGLTSDGLHLGEDALNQLPAWLAYKSSLNRRGYFEGNIPGSERCESVSRNMLICLISSAWSECYAAVSHRYKKLLSMAVSDFCSGPLLPRALTLASDPVLRALRAMRAAGEACVGGGDDEGFGQRLTPEGIGELLRQRGLDGLEPVAISSDKGVSCNQVWTNVGVGKESSD